MGKGRIIAEQKIAALEAEMKEYAQGQGKLGVLMTKRFKLDIIHYARQQDMTIDSAIIYFRTMIKKLIDEQKKPSSLPAKMPTLH